MYERENALPRACAGRQARHERLRLREARRAFQRITGARWIPDDTLQVKLEGARRVGERYMGIVAIRDPYVIRNIDAAIEWSRGRRREEIRQRGLRAPLPRLRPRRRAEGDGAGEGANRTKSPSSSRASRRPTSWRRRSPTSRRACSSSPACPAPRDRAGSPRDKETMRSSPGYVWNVNHVMSVNDPMELFPAHTTEAEFRSSACRSFRSRQDHPQQERRVNQITFDIIFPDAATYERVARQRRGHARDHRQALRHPEEPHLGFRELRHRERDQVHDLPEKPAAARATGTSSAPSSTRR